MVQAIHFAGDIKALPFHPQDSLLAMATTRRNLILWDYARKTARVQSHPGDWYERLHWVGGHRLLALDEKGTLHVSGDNGDFTARSAHTILHDVKTVSVDEQGRRFLAVTCSGQAILQGIDEGNPVKLPMDDWKEHAAFLRGTSYAYTLSRKGDDWMLRLRDTASGKFVQALSRPDNHLKISKVLASKTTRGGRIVALNENGSINVWDLRSFSSYASLQPDGMTYLMEITAGGALFTAPAIGPFQTWPLYIENDVIAAEPAHATRLWGIGHSPEPVITKPREKVDECAKTAWTIARAPGQTAHEYECARNIAITACVRDTADWKSLRTLGVAEYRLGNFNNAISLLNTAMSLREAFPEEDPESRAFLSTVCLQGGNALLYPTAPIGDLLSAALGSGHGSLEMTYWGRPFFDEASGIRQWDGHSIHDVDIPEDLYFLAREKLPPKHVALFRIAPGHGGGWEEILPFGKYKIEEIAFSLPLRSITMMTDSGIREIWSIDSQSHEARLIWKSDSMPIEHLSWHPDRPLFYFALGESRDGFYSYGMMRADASWPLGRQSCPFLTTPGQEFNHLQISPNNQWVCFTHYPRNSWSFDLEIWIAELSRDGLAAFNPRQLTAFPEASNAPQFSPDSRHLYWILQRKNQDGNYCYALCSMTRDGTDKRILYEVQYPNSLYRLAVSDSGWLAVSLGKESGRDNNNRIVLLEPSTRRSFLLSHEDLDLFWPAFAGP